jgi:choline dehydrogenase-like flavoprotein
MADIEADVIIVGSGIAGALLAARLAVAGVKVAILEAGARVDRAQATQRFWDAPIKVPECPYPPSPQADHPISNDPDHWYRQVGPDKFRSTYVKVVGGTTWHWLGTCLRLVPNDLRLSTAYGRGVDWPIAYADLEPFYGQAEHEIGVSGDSAETLGSPRSTRYPMPAIPQTFLDKAYARALAGTQYEVRATPQGRNSTDRDDRPGCCGNASCIPICPIQAKYDATMHVSRAEKSGAALHAETTATIVEVGPDGRATAIRFKRWDGSEGTASGRVFVLAAHAIEIPRLLLNSRTAATPNGVANGSDQVGRNLMDHPIQLSWALAPTPVWPYRGRCRPPASRTFGTARSARTGRPFASRSAMTAGRGPKPRRRPARPNWRAAVCAPSPGRRVADAGVPPPPPRLADRAAARSGEPRHTRCPRDGRLRRAAASPCLSPRRLCPSRPVRRPRRAYGDLWQARRDGNPASGRRRRRRAHHRHRPNGQRSKKLGGRP